MSITLEQALIFALAVVAAIALAKYVFKKDEQEEDRRLKLAEVADWCKEMKLPRLSEIFNRFAVGDGSGAARAIRSLVDLLTEGSDAERLKAMEPAFWHQLTLRLQDEEQRVKIVKVVDDAKASAAARKQREFAEVARDPEIPTPAVQATPAKAPA